jgi:hypothetical protein
MYLTLSTLVPGGWVTFDQIDDAFVVLEYPAAAGMCCPASRGNAYPAAVGGGKACPGGAGEEYLTAVGGGNRYPIGGATSMPSWSADFWPADF